MKNYLLITILSLVFCSCSQPDFRPLEPNVKNGIVLETKYWHGFMDPTGGFELRLKNNSNAPIRNCRIIFDDKYEHSVNGLFSREKGIVKDSVMAVNDILTFQFAEDISNADYFKIEQKNYFPKTIGLKCDNCDMKWNFDK